jgi:succinate dehydrogenase/fumarate reductase flavoprotein subunit
MPVEVAPIAHYHMGGIAVDTAMRTGLPGLYAAGEAVSGANGANRLSGNAVTEALVFGREAGRSAADYAATMQAVPAASSAAPGWLGAGGTPRDLNTAEMVQALQATMQDDVGPLRDETKLTRALAHIDSLAAALGETPPGASGAFDMRVIDWLDLRNMLLVARAVAQAALVRTESRGAQQREDYPQTAPDWAASQFVTLADGQLTVARAARPVQAAAS